MGMALFPVDLELLKEIFALPESYRIASFQPHETMPGVVNFVIASDDIPEVAEGGKFPRINPHYQVDYHPDNPEFRKMTFAPTLEPIDFVPTAQSR